MDKKYERRLWMVGLAFTLIAGMTAGVSLANYYGNCQGAL